MTLRRRVILLEQTQPPAAALLPTIELGMAAAEAGEIYARLIRRLSFSAGQSIVDVFKIKPADAAAAYGGLVA